MKKIGFVVLLPCLLILAAGVARGDSAKAGEDNAAGRLASLMVDRENIARTFDAVVEVAMKHPKAAEMDAAQRREFKEKARSLKTNLMEILPWDKVRENMAAEYAKRFTGEELQQILAFYETGAGKKMLEIQPDLMAGMTARMVDTLTEEQLTMAAAKNLMQLESKLEGRAKAAVEKAKKAETFPAESLHGRWYGIDLTDPDLTSYWWHEKGEDGRNTVGGLDIDMQDKSFTEYEDPGAYVMIGRLLIETATEETDFSNVFILEKVTKDLLVYLIVDEESPFKEWERMVDQREPIDPPKIPKGFKKSE